MRWIIGAAVAAGLCSSVAIADDHEERLKEQRALQDNWLHCLLVFGQTVAATTGERAEVIAEAAFTGCRPEEEALYEFFSAGPSPVVAEFVRSRLFPKIRENYRQEVIAKVLVVRASQQLQQ